MSDELALAWDDVNEDIDPHAIPKAEKIDEGLYKAILSGAEAKRSERSGNPMIVVNLLLVEQLSDLEGKPPTSEVDKFKDRKLNSYLVFTQKMASRSANLVAELLEVDPAEQKKEGPTLNKMAERLFMGRVMNGETPLQVQVEITRTTGADDKESTWAKVKGLAKNAVTATELEG